MSGARAALSGGGERPRRRSTLPGGESEEQDMTPMMNILIILISFLVTMVVFTHISVVKFSLPPGGGGENADAGTAGTAPEKEAKDLTVLVSESGYQVMADGQTYPPRPKTPDGYDVEALAGDLQEAKKSMPFNESVVLLIDSAVIYQDVIATMDVCRENRFAKVLLSGGLAE